MTFILALLALLPGIALAGPVMIGWYFGSDWVLKVGLAFDVIAVGLGVACLVLFAGTPAEAAPATAASSDLLTFLGVGLVGFGALFGVVAAWLLWREPAG